MVNFNRKGYLKFVNVLPAIVAFGRAANLKNHVTKIVFGNLKKLSIFREQGKVIILFAYSSGIGNLFLMPYSHL